MATVPPPAKTRKPKLPPPRKQPSPKTTEAPPPKSDLHFGVARGKIQTAQKVVIYGAGGIGKTELASLIAKLGIAPLFLDLEDGSAHLDVARVNPPIQNFDGVLSALRDERLLKDFGAVVVDSLTKADEFSVTHTLTNVPHEKGHYVKSIEGYGWGKGLIHNYETFLQLLAQLDVVARYGKHVICTAHDCTANVPNPNGEDWIRYEPRLQSPASGRGSIRHRVKEWCGHLLFIGFDAFVNAEGKAVGSGTRTIYPTELPSHWAKSRTLAEPFEYVKGDAELWRRLLNKEDE